jgi:hypothetical protein
MKMNLILIQTMWYSAEHDSASTADVGTMMDQFLQTLQRKMHRVLATSYLPGSWEVVKYNLYGILTNLTCLVDCCCCTRPWAVEE